MLTWKWQPPYMLTKLNQTKQELAALQLVPLKYRSHYLEVRLHSYSPSHLPSYQCAPERKKSLSKALLYRLIQSLKGLLNAPVFKYICTMVWPVSDLLWLQTLANKAGAVDALQ